VARSRFRSVRYDLAASVEVARLVDAAGGTLGADLLAPALGYSGTNNGAYLARVATARLFGVVSGRASRFELTGRGRQILEGSEPESTAARREAFLAVPLFRAVAEHATRHGGALPEDLAPWLVDEFGEVPGKARGVADRLIGSAGQAGLLQRGDDGNFLLTNSFTTITPVEKEPVIARRSRVGWRKGTGSSQGRDVAMTEGDLWLDEESEGVAKRGPAWRRVGVVAAAAAVLVAVAVPAALVASGSPSTPTALHSADLHPKLGNGPAEHQVLSALSATTDTGNFDFSYNISSTSATASASVPTTTSTTVCNEVREVVPPVMPNAGGTSVGSSSSASSGSASSSGSSASKAVVMPSQQTVVQPATAASPSLAVAGPNDPAPYVPVPSTGTLPRGSKMKTVRVCGGSSISQSISPPIQGSGVINTNPIAMVASANIGNGLNVAVRIDGTDVYEEASGDTGLAPPTSEGSASGSSIPGFAGITESTLGTREGAVAMMGMASPTGYLDLIQPAIDAASETGTSTVDGVPVTVYQVSNNLDQLADSAGTTSAESQTITAALALLKGQGFTANTAQVSIDGNGLIRQVKTVDTFADGGTVTLAATFSNFGCAGTVLMPGQTGSGVPPSNCTPSTGSTTPTTSAATTPSTVPTTNVTPTTVHSSVSPTTSTTAPPSSSTTTTIVSTPSSVVPASTTTTAP
jgi:hypothetical protein